MLFRSSGSEVNRLMVVRVRAGEVSVECDISLRATGW